MHFMECIAAKGPKSRSHGQMKQYNAGAPFERVAMDVAGPFPMSKQGNKYVLVVMDYFSKWPEVYPIPNQEAKTVADAFTNNNCYDFTKSPRLFSRSFGYDLWIVK